MYKVNELLNTRENINQEIRYKYSRCFTAMQFDNKHKTFINAWKGINDVIEIIDTSENKTYTPNFFHTSLKTFVGSLSLSLLFQSRKAYNHDAKVLFNCILKYVLPLRCRKSTFFLLFIFQKVMGLLSLQTFSKFVFNKTFIN